MLFIHVIRAYLALRKLRKLRHTHSTDLAVLLRQVPEEPRVLLISADAPQLPLYPPCMN